MSQSEAKHFHRLRRGVAGYAARRPGPGSAGKPSGGNSMTIVGILVVIILVLLVIYLFQRVR